MIHWVLSWDRGGARGYASKEQQEALDMREAHVDFISEVQVTVIRDGVATLTFMMSTSRLRRGDVVRLARELYRHGIRVAYAERGAGHSLPFGIAVESGPMMGMMFMDVAAVVAGS